MTLRRIFVARGGITAQVRSAGADVSRPLSEGEVKAAMDRELGGAFMGERLAVSGRRDGDSVLCDGSLHVC
jgi:hypothetical protein